MYDTSLSIIIIFTQLRAITHVYNYQFTFHEWLHCRLEQNFTVSCIYRPQNDLNCDCVEWDSKPYSTISYLIYIQYDMMHKYCEHSELRLTSLISRIWSKQCNFHVFQFQM